MYTIIETSNFCASPNIHGFYKTRKEAERALVEEYNNALLENEVAEQDSPCNWCDGESAASIEINEGMRIYFSVRQDDVSEDEEAYRQGYSEGRQMFEEDVLGYLRKRIECERWHIEHLNDELLDLRYDDFTSSVEERIVRRERKVHILKKHLIQELLDDISSTDMYEWLV